MKLTSDTGTASVAALLLAFLAGCTSSGVQNPKGVGVTEMKADERGFVVGTGIESQDIVTVADKMARGMMALPQISQATTPPYVVLDPVINETRFPINKDIFLTRMMTQMTSRSGGKVIFLARERMEALQKERDLKRQGQVTATTDPNVQEFKGADYFLTGKLQGLSTRTSKGTSDYVLYSFQMIDARTSAIVWAGDHEIKRQGLEDAVYR
jgi:hypothetical protein